MDGWYCRLDYGWIGAVIDVLFVVGLASWWWREQGWHAGLRRGAGALSVGVTLLALLLGVPMTSHVLFDGPDLCVVAPFPEELSRALRDLVFAQVMLVGALVTPFVLTPSRHPASWPPPGWLARGVGWVVGWALVGVGLWRWHHVSGAIDTHGLTVWGIGFGVTVALAFGRALDLLVAPVGARLSLLAMTVPFVYFGVFGVASPDEVVSTEPQGDWYAAARARLGAIPEGGPVILVAASGGGARAATFATLVLETLSRPGDQHFAYADPDHVIDVAFEHPPSAYIWLISGVSGGSVGTAHYLARHYGSGGRGRESGAPMQTGYPASMRPSGLQPQVADLVEALLDDPHLDEVMTDFNAPAIRGMLTPWSTRGRGLADYWDTRFGWEESFSATSPTPRPLAVFNAVLVASGRRLLIGEPPLPPELLKESYDRNLDTLPGRALDRVRPVALSELDERLRPTVGEAVRMSASFPFGMDMAVLQARHTPASWPPTAEGEPTGTRTLEIGDGGMVENTGTATIIDLLRALATNAVHNADAAWIASELRRRGVLVVEIDSGAKPTADIGVSTQLLHPVASPASSLTECSYTGERSAVTLRRVSNPLRAQRWSWASFVYCPKSAEQSVMTAWALGADEQADLLDMYATTTLDGTCFPERGEKSAKRASPLNVIAAAFQPADAIPTIDEARLGDPAPVGPVAAWSAIDAHLRHGDVPSALVGARRAFGPSAPSEARLAAVADALHEAERVEAGKVVPIGVELANEGWIVSRRWLGDTLVWAKIDVPAAVPGDHLAGSLVRVTHRVTVHEQIQTGGADLPVALAGPAAALSVKEVQMVGDERDRWEMARVAWDVRLVPRDRCLDENVDVTWCTEGGAPARRGALLLAGRLAASGRFSDGCVSVLEVGKGVFLEPARTHWLAEDTVGRAVTETLASEPGGPAWEPAQAPKGGVALRVGCGGSTIASP